MAKVRGNGSQLDRALRDVTEAWAATGEGWHDQAHEDFAEQQFYPLQLRTRQAVRAISSLEELLMQAEQECS